MKNKEFEYQQFDPKWDNGYCVPYFNSQHGQFYEKDVFTDEVIQGSECESLRELRRKMKRYKSPEL